MSSHRIPLAWKNLVHRPRPTGRGRLRHRLRRGSDVHATGLSQCRCSIAPWRCHRLFVADLVRVTSAARYTVSVKETFSRRRLAQALACPAIEAARPLYIETAQSIWKNPQTGQGHPIRVLAFDPREPVLALAGFDAASLELPDTLAVDRRSKGDYGVPGDRRKNRALGSCHADRRHVRAGHRLCQRRQLSS